jgi:glutamyl-tRNA synthetase
MDELKDRATTLNQIAEESAFFSLPTPLTYNEKASQILDDTPTDLLLLLKDKLNELETFNSENIQSVCKQIAKDHLEKKMGKVAMPLRAAIAGTTVTPSVFSAAEILGKQEVIMRLSYAIDKFGSKTLSQVKVN